MGGASELRPEGRPAASVVACSASSLSSTLDSPPMKLRMSAQKKSPLFAYFVLACYPGSASKLYSA